MAYTSYQSSGPSRLIGIGLVVLLHVGIIYALVMSLAHRSVEVTHAPIETKIIDQAPPPRPEQPPPPPPQLASPPPLYVPPPEINIAHPPPPQSTAPTVVTTVKPPAPPVTAPVSILPRIDAQHSHELEYPLQARRMGEQGAVVLQILVGLDGRVTDSKLVTSSGFPDLDQAALAGVKTSYRFIPGTVDGKAQPMWHTITVNWKLR